MMELRGRSLFWISSVILSIILFQETRAVLYLNVENFLFIFVNVMLLNDVLNVNSTVIRAG